MIEILIVEDEPPIARDIALQIEHLDSSSSFTIHTASNGVDALRYISAHRVDVVFTDVRMPLMDGISLAAELEKSNPAIPVVIISGYADYAYTRQAINHGVFDYLLKPLNGDELAKVLERIIALLKERESRQWRANLQALVRMPPSRPVGLPDFIQRKMWYAAVITYSPYPVYAINQRDQQLFPEGAERLLMEMERRHEAKESAFYLFEGHYLAERVLLFTERVDPQMLLSALTRAHANQDQTLARIAMGESPIPAGEIYDTLSCCRQYLREHICCAQSLAVTVAQGRPRCLSYAYSCHPPLIERVRTALMSRSYDAYHRALQELLAAIGSYPLRQIHETLSHLANTAIADSGRSDNDPGRLEIGMAIDRDILLSGNRQELINRIQRSFDALFGFGEDSDQARNANQYLESIQAYLKANYRQQISNQELAEAFHLDPSYLGRLYKKRFGISPQQYLLKLKIEHAQGMIRSDPAIRFQTVAEYLGYHDALYFSKVFKKYTGFYPSAFKRMLKQRTRSES